MSKYLRNFNTEASFADALASGVSTPLVAYVSETGKSYVIPEDAWGVSIPVDGSVALSRRGSSTAWNNYKAKIGRYLMNDAGEARKLLKTDSSRLADGSVFDTGSGNVMVRIPRLYYLSVTDTANRITLWMSESPFADNVIEEQWVGAYLGYVSGGKFRSMAGVNPTRNYTISQFHSYAQANGSAWGLEDYTQRKLMYMLYLSEYLNLNSQASLGNGMTGDSGNWTTQVQSETTGRTSSLGDGCGRVAYTTTGTNANHVSLFGIEDSYGWFWEMIQGCYFGNSGNAAQTGSECYLYEGNRMPSSNELATHPISDYKQLARVTSSGWAKLLIGGGDFEILPKALGGGSSSYICDYHYANNTGQLLLWGGNADFGSMCGLAYSYSNDAFSRANSDIGSRLAFYGKPIIY